MSEPETPENPPEEDINVVSDARDDVLVRPRGKHRDEHGRLTKGHRVLPGAGRPIECARKARKTLQNIRGWTIIGEIGEGKRVANPGQVEALKLLLDRGYGKVVDVQTHLHLMAGASEEEKSGLSVLSADALTALARSLMLPATTAPTRVDEDVVEGEFVEAGSEAAVGE